MIAPRCRHEDEIRQAVVSGRWPAGLEAHADGCDVCREVRLVASALNASEPAQPPRDVEPRALFACARQVRRINVESKISFILTAAQAVVFVVIAAVLLSFVKWSAVAQLWSMRADARTWIYATAGLAIAVAFGISRWMTQES
jgi:hypothetical protein